jgi:GT2 family glycosyltransferase
MLNQTSKMTIAESNTLPRLKPQPQAGSARVAVVIVVWNAKHYVMECLESLREHCEQACSEVIVVDNASTDGTPELVAEMFPEFKLIRNPENFGFAKANNIGMAQSLAEYVCLVNSDVKFLDDSISPMVRYLDDHSGVGMLGPKMLAPTGEVRRSTMRFPTVWNNFCRAFGLDSLFKKSRLFGGMLMSDFDHQTTVPVEVLNGWFILVRRSAIERVGGLDPQFFMYGEDVDWSYRFRQAGEQVVFLRGSWGGSLWRSEFSACAGSLLPGNVPRHLAVLAKASQRAGSTRLSGCVCHPSFDPAAEFSVSLSVFALAPARHRRPVQAKSGLPAVGGRGEVQAVGDQRKNGVRPSLDGHRSAR